MTATALLLDPSSLEQTNAAIDYPRPDRLVTGNPQRLTHSLYEHPNMSCGIWQCEVGAWNIVFADNKQEFFQVIEGIVRLHDTENKSFVEISAGQASIIPPSFVGTFEVVEAVKKYYVVVEA